MGRYSFSSFSHFSLNIKNLLRCCNWLICAACHRTSLRQFETQLVITWLSNTIFDDFFFWRSACQNSKIFNNEYPGVNQLQNTQLTDVNQLQQHTKSVAPVIVQPIKSWEKVTLLASRESEKASFIGFCSLAIR